MNCNIRDVGMDEVKRTYVNYDYALVYLMSEKIFCRVEGGLTIKWDECLDARFFSDGAELHVYEDDGELKAVEVTEMISECGTDMSGKDGTHVYDCEAVREEYLLDGKYINMGKKLVVRRYLKPDEDGQMQVVLTRLAGVE